MSSKTLLLSAAIAGLLWMPSKAAAQTIVDQPVYFTFSGPVALPGMTLQAGKYMFKQTRSNVERETIQVFDDKGKSLGVAMAIPAARTNGEPVPEKPEVNFYEASPGGAAQAVHIYWYPGIRTGGHEFVYPRAQAEQIAKASHTSVLTTTGNDVNSGSLTRVSENGTTEQSASASMAPPEPRSAPAATPAPAPAAAPDLQANASTPAPAPRRALPKTASELPVVAGVGVLSLFAGLVLAARRRIA